jgi:hypothetical protein
MADECLMTKVGAPTYCTLLVTCVKCLCIRLDPNIQLSVLRRRLYVLNYITLILRISQGASWNLGHELVQICHLFRHCSLDSAYLASLTQVRMNF